jgi:hypothetical protein
LLKRRNCWRKLWLRRELGCEDELGWTTFLGARFTYSGAEALGADVKPMTDRNGPSRWTSVAVGYRLAHQIYDGSSESAMRRRIGPHDNRSEGSLQRSHREGCLACELNRGLCRSSSGKTGHVKALDCHARLKFVPLASRLSRARTSEGGCIRVRTMSCSLQFLGLDAPKYLRRYRRFHHRHC